MNESENNLELYSKNFIQIFSTFLPGILGNILIYSNLKKIGKKTSAPILTGILYYILHFGHIIMCSIIYVLILVDQNPIVAVFST